MGPDFLWPSVCPNPPSQRKASPETPRMPRACPGPNNEMDRFKRLATSAFAYISASAANMATAVTCFYVSCPLLQREKKNSWKTGTLL